MSIEGLWVRQTIASRVIRVISVFGTSDAYRTDKRIPLRETCARMEAACVKGHRQYEYPADSPARSVGVGSPQGTRCRLLPELRGVLQRLEVMLGLRVRPAHHYDIWDRR